jgi:hypothetical protein
MIRSKLCLTRTWLSLLGSRRRPAPSFAFQPLGFPPSTTMHHYRFVFGPPGFCFAPLRVSSSDRMSFVSSHLDQAISPTRYLSSLSWKRSITGFLGPLAFVLESRILEPELEYGIRMLESPFFAPFLILAKGLCA